MRTLTTTRAILAAAAALGLLATVAARAADDEITKGMKKTESGLQFKDIKAGNGPMPKRGQTAKVHYTGWLWQDNAKGKKFDSSVDRGQPFDFSVGTGMVIKGWDEGVATMKVGGKRYLLIPPALGYGARGAGADIPPNSTLLFEVELLGIE